MRLLVRQAESIATTIFVLIVIPFLSMAQQAQPDSNFHLYLLVGQSNMAGRGAVDETSKQVNPRIMMLDSFNHWVNATDPVHFDKPAIAGVGPAIGFANAMLSGENNIRIGLIPCAWGGSPIKAWEPGATYLQQHPYEFAVSRAKIGMQRGVLKGILWHQGESDNDSSRAGVYIEKLAALIQRLRADLNDPTLPFVAGEIGYFNNSTLINNEINKLPLQVPHTAVVSAKELTDKGDHVHFDTRSARELGKRYAEAIKKLQATITRNTGRKNSTK